MAQAFAVDGMQYLSLMNWAWLSEVGVGVEVLLDLLPCFMLLFRAQMLRYRILTQNHILDSHNVP